MSDRSTYKAEPVIAAPHMLLSWWHTMVDHSVDREQVLAAIVEDSGWSAHFAIMAVLSAGIAMLGLLLSSPAVVIGAMLISPLMGPIIGLGFAVATFDSAWMRQSLSALLGGIGLATAFCALIVWLSPLQTVTEEIAARIRPNLFDLLVALFSGLAGTYAMIRGRHGTIVGVAIATALMPPLAVVGFGLATANWTVLAGSFLLFFTNLMTIAASAAVLARIYGFAPDLSPRQTRMQAALVICVLLALAVPLGLSLNRIAWEALAAREARQRIVDRFGDEARLSDMNIDFHVAPVEVTATVLTPKLDGDAERALTQDLSRRLDRAVEVTVDQVQIRAGNSEAMEIAVAKAPPSDHGAARQNDRVVERLALVAGVAPDQVMTDPTRKRALVRSSVLPGASLEAYRVLEARVAQAGTNWTVTLIPPAVGLPSVSTSQGAPDESGRRAIDTAAWAAKRLNLAIGVAAPRKDEVDSIIAAFKAAGIEAQQVNGDLPDSGAGLRWLAPEPAPPAP